MWRTFLLALSVASASSAEVPLYELSGTFTPAGLASVSLFGVNGPFSAFALSDSSGRFSFKKLEAGAYTLAVFLPTEGEARRTIDSARRTCQ